MDDQAELAPGATLLARHAPERTQNGRRSLTAATRLAGIRFGHGEHADAPQGGRGASGWRRG
ncbi:hypothetical protein [Streptomyces sp. Y7]|uniref:hypothetical protein n=1 Tax=Streptomyces sp. Y7 TaxID=3342392 RepID=UPI0037135CD3